MAKLLKLRRGTTTQHGSFTGAEGEVTIDTTKDTAVVHDGSQAGGRALLREDMSNLPAGTIDNADVNASAAISGTKISPDFGSQDITTTGKIKFANMYASTGNLPSASTYHGMFAHVHDTGAAYFAHNGSWWRLVNRDSNGGVDIPGNLDVGAGLDVTGDLTLPVDGDKLKIGASGDIEIFHDGNHSNIMDKGTGNLAIHTNGTEIQLAHNNNAGTFEHMVRCVVDGAVELYHNGSDKFATNSSGAEVRGNLAVTGTVDGRDVAADGTKLDGIESGATADQTKSDIDGLNINADQVDGMHANEFLAVAGDQATGDITFSGGAGAVTVAAGSDIRIAGGTWTGEYSGGLKLQADASHSYWQYHGTTYFRAGGGSNTATLDASGNFTATGNVTAYSDARLKTDISTINDALGICGKLRGVSYKWIRDGKASIGVIAQEVEEVIPEVVLTSQDLNPSTGESIEVKSVDYGKIVGVLINAINELKAEVDELKGGK